MDDPTQDWGDLHNSLVNTLTAPETMAQHPQLPASAPQGDTDIAPNLNGPMRHFEGDKSIQAYASDVGDTYEKAMSEAGVPKELIDKARPTVESQASQKAKAFALQKLQRSTLTEQIGQYVPLAGHLAKGIESYDAKKAADSIEAGKGNAYDYVSLGRQLSAQSDEEKRSWLAKRGRNLLGLAQFMGEFALTGGAGSAVGTEAVARLGGGKALQYAGAGLGMTAAMPQRPLAEYFERQNRQVGVDEEGKLTFADPESKAASAWKATASSFIDNTIMPGVAGAFTRAEAGSYASRVVKKSLMAFAGIEASADTKKLLSVSPQGGPGWQIAQALASGDQMQIKHALAEAAGTMVEMGLLEGVVQSGRRGHSVDKASNDLIQRLVETAPAPEAVQPDVIAYQGMRRKFAQETPATQEAPPQAAPAPPTPAVPASAVEPPKPAAPPVVEPAKPVTPAAPDPFHGLEESHVREMAKFLGLKVDKKTDLGKVKAAILADPNGAAIIGQGEVKAPEPLPPQKPPTYGEPTELPPEAPEPPPVAPPGPPEAPKAPEVVQPTPAAPEAKPEPGRPQPITSTSRKELLDRVEKGADNLTDQEKQVVYERLLWATGFREIGETLGVSHQQAALLERRALRKMGFTGTVDELHLGSKGEQAVVAAENGDEVFTDDLHRTDRSYVGTNHRVEEIAQAHEALDALDKKLAKDKRSGRLTPERRAEHAAEFERLRRIIDEGQGEDRPAEGVPEQTPGTTSGTTPVRPEAGPGVSAQQPTPAPAPVEGRQGGAEGQPAHGAGEAASHQLDKKVRDWRRNNERKHAEVFQEAEAEGIPAQHIHERARLLLDHNERDIREYRAIRKEAMEALESYGIKTIVGYEDIIPHADKIAEHTIGADRLRPLARRGEGAEETLTRILQKGARQLSIQEAYNKSLNLFIEEKADEAIRQAARSGIHARPAQEALSSGIAAGETETAGEPALGQPRFVRENERGIPVDEHGAELFAAGSRQQRDQQRTERANRIAEVYNRIAPQRLGQGVQINFNHEGVTSVQVKDGKPVLNIDPDHIFKQTGGNLEHLAALADEESLHLNWLLQTNSKGVANPEGVWHSLSKPLQDALKKLHPSFEEGTAQQKAGEIFRMQEQLQGGRHITEWFTESKKLLAEHAEALLRQEGDKLPPPVPPTPDGLKVMSTKNAMVDQERVARGMPPAMEEARRSFGQVWDEAMQRAAQGEHIQTALIDELAKKPRPVSDVENALLLHREITLNNALEKVARELQANPSPEVQGSFNALNTQLETLFDATKAVGRETARGLNARKMMARENFTLARMLASKKAALGRELTAEEKDQVFQTFAAISRLGQVIDKATESAGGPEELAKSPKLQESIDNLLLDQKKQQKGFLDAIKKDLRGQQPLAGRIFSEAKESLSLSRSIITAFDFSAVGRQGWFMALSHPLKAIEALPDMFRAAFSEQSAGRAALELGRRPNAALYEKSGLYLADLNGPLSAAEEAYMSRWTRKIPGIAGSERAYTTFLNRMRADTFDAMVKWSGTGDGAIQAVANYVNVSSGRGKLGSWEPAAKQLATALFSPRFVASRFQLLLGEPLYRGPMSARYAVAMEYGRALVGLGVVYALGSLAGAQMEDDPRSSDFGKMRFGDSRIDPLAGLSQTTVLLSRLGTGQYKDRNGKMHDMRGPNVKFGQMKVADAIHDFEDRKLAPVPGAALQLLTGENPVHEPVTLPDIAGGLVVPMSIRDIYESMKTQGVPGGAALGLLAIFGTGVQNYQQRPRKR